jgi:hypothetical protein
MVDLRSTTNGWSALAAWSSGIVSASHWTGATGREIESRHGMRRMAAIKNGGKMKPKIFKST